MPVDPASEVFHFSSVWGLKQTQSNLHGAGVVRMEIAPGHTVHMLVCALTSLRLHDLLIGLGGERNPTSDALGFVKIRTEQQESAWFRHLGAHTPLLTQREVAQFREANDSLSYTKDKEEIEGANQTGVAIAALSGAETLAGDPEPPLKGGSRNSSSTRRTSCTISPATLDTRTSTPREPTTDTHAEEAAVRPTAQKE